MVRCVCAHHDVNCSRLPTQLTARGMVVKRLSPWRFGLWSHVDYVFFLVLLLVCHPVPSSSSSPAPTSTVTGGTTANTTSAHLSTTKSATNSLTVPLSTNPLTKLSTEVTENSVTSSYRSTTNPETTLKTELHSTDDITTETTPYASTEITTISLFTENTTISEAPTTSPSTENTTTIFTSTENTTLSEATTLSPSTENTTTISPSTENTTIISPSTENTTIVFTSTENTTLSVTTSNSTFTATPDPSSTAYTNKTTPLLPASNETFTTTVSTPWYCSNGFYWMTASVDVMGTPQSEQNITTQFEEFFGRNLNACKVQTNLTSVLTTTSISSVTQELKNLFEALELTCDQKNITTNAHCYILLKLRAPANVCCIRNTVTEMNSNINVSVVGQIERVGVCADNMAHILDGQYDKYNHTLDVCNEKPQNVSCGNSTNVIFPLVTGAPEECSSPPSPTCHCTSRCNSSDFYYYSTITFSHTVENAESHILNAFNSACQNMTSVCNTPQTFKSHIKDSNVICEKNVTALSICEIIVKLDTCMDLSSIQEALTAILEPFKNFTTVEVVNRVAICFNTSSESLKQTLKWQPSLSTNFSSDVCMESNRQNLNGYCSAGSSIIPLNESCSSSTIPFQNVTTAPPSFTSTSLSNITSNATVTLVSTSANVTSSVSSNTSGTVNSDELLNLSANASSLSASEVDKLLSQLESLLSGPNVSLALANTSVNIVNNLLDVPVAVINPFSKRAIRIVDTVGLKLVVSETSQSVLSESLALGVKKVDGDNFQETSFSLLESSNLQIRSNPGPAAEDIVFRVGSTPLGSVTLPALLTQNLTAEQKQLASRVQFNFFQKSTFFQDKSLGNRKLNSRILGSSVGNLSLSGLQKEVLITLRNTEPIPANYVASCVFWDFSFNDGSGGWNPSGCRVVISSAEETQCACNHLTSFGILLDISKTVIPPEHLIILTYITYIGCGISAIFLSVTLLTYLAFGKLRKDIPSKILIQLCFALLMLNLVFLVDSWLALYPDAVGLCISTAFFLHYFLLASFTWMALEAVHMYLALVKVFNTYISRFMVKIGFAGWGIPLIVVIIVIAINKDNYGLVTYGKLVDGATSDFCWIKNDIAFYVAVVAYFCLVFLLNFAMFIVVMIQLYRIKKQNPHNVQYRSGWQEMRSIAGLTVLLGLTWGFAFFAWGPVNLAFMYLFAIFNSLQGLFIFIFHCAMKENVRRQWRTYLCCGKLRTSENSEWSHTATQNRNKPSRERTPFHSSISNNSRLSFLNHDSLSSDVPMGVGNPVDDRIITAAEEPMSSSDVVLNEINDHYRGQRSY